MNDIILARLQVADERLEAEEVAVGIHIDVDFNALSRAGCRRILSLLMMDIRPYAPLHHLVNRFLKKCFRVDLRPSMSTDDGRNIGGSGRRHLPETLVEFHGNDVAMTPVGMQNLFAHPVPLIHAPVQRAARQDEQEHRRGTDGILDALIEDTVGQFIEIQEHLKAPLLQLRLQQARIFLSAHSSITDENVVLHIGNGLFLGLKAMITLQRYTLFLTHQNFSGKNVGEGRRLRAGGCERERRYM